MQISKTEYILSFDDENRIKLVSTNVMLISYSIGQSIVSLNGKKINIEVIEISVKMLTENESYYVLNKNIV